MTDADETPASAAVGKSLKPEAAERLMVLREADFGDADEKLRQPVEGATATATTSIHGAPFD